MGNDIVLSGFGESGERHNWLSRQARDLRAIEQRTELDLANIVSDANKKALRAELRKRFTEKVMYDTREVVDLLKQLSGGDELMVAALMPIVQEFIHQETRDVRNFNYEEWGL